MLLSRRFNLVEEPWIPVAGKGTVSLASVFSDNSLTALGGNPLQKVALTKLLLSIAQSAYTPIDDDDWIRVGPSGIADKAFEYLQEQRDRFWLYGDQPFLQMPSIVRAAKQRFGAVQTFTATGNTTLLTQSQAEPILTDAEKAVLVVELMSLGLGGKKADNSVVLTPDYQGKSNEKGRPSTGKPGPSIGYMGFLHSFMLGECLMQTLWLNIFTEEDLHERFRRFPNGVGIAPWEEMPQGEDCHVAQALRASYMGRLVPVSRFVLLADDGIHYSEGISHPGYADGGVDPSVAVDSSGAKAKAIWADPERRPWRQLPALLSFLSSEKGHKSTECMHLLVGVPRAKAHTQQFTVWSGGLRVSSNAGEQYVSGSDDFVESEVHLYCKELGDIWFANLKAEMDLLDQFAKITWSAVLAYNTAQKADGKGPAAQAVNLFWQLCERRFQELLSACGDTSGEEVKRLRPAFAGFVEKAYNSFCPRDTARQADSWAENLPNLSRYLR